MDAKDTYLWGTLLALVREQLAAIEKQVAGDLGMWGKMRSQSRNKAMQKFLFKLFLRKVQAHGDDAAKAMHAMQAELEQIEKDKKTWSDITPEELQYVRNILGSIG